MNPGKRAFFTWKTKDKAEGMHKESLMGVMKKPVQTGIRRKTNPNRRHPADTCTNPWRQPKTACKKAYTIVKNLVFSLFLILCLCAFTYVDAIREADQKERGLTGVSELLHLAHKFITTTKTDPSTALFLKFWSNSIKEFDFNQLYESPFLGPMENGYRGVYIKGRNLPDGYFLGMTTKEESRDYTETLGNFNLKVGLRKNEQSIVGDPSFSGYIRAKAFVKRYSMYNLLALLEGLIRVVDPENVKQLCPPESNMFPNISGPARNAINDLYRALPNFCTLSDKYVHVHKVMQIKEHEGIFYTHYNLKLTAKLDAMKRDYPHIERYMRRIQHIFRIYLALRTFSGNNIFEFNLNSDINSSVDFISISYCTKEGLVIPYDKEGVPVFSEAYELKKLEDFTFYTELDIFSNVYGLKILTDNILATTLYQLTKISESMDFKLARVPDCEVYGRAYHIVPRWVIDLVIPGNIDAIINKFSRVMVHANKGEGSVARFHWDTKNPENIVFTTLASSELVDNFFIRFGFRIWQDKFSIDRETFKEMKSIVAKLIQAMIEDIHLHIDENQKVEVIAQ